MTIDASAVSLTPESAILQSNLAVEIILQLTDMKGETVPIRSNDDFDRFPRFHLSDPKPETLQDLVEMIIRRQHPVMEYIADRNGIKVIQYKERPSFAQSMSCISYDSQDDCPL